MTNLAAISLRPRLRPVVEAALLAGALAALGVAAWLAVRAWGDSWMLAGAGGTAEAEARRLFLAGEREWRTALGRGANALDSQAADKAEGLLRQALALNPQMPEAYERLADLEELKGNRPGGLIERAQAALLEANSQSPAIRLEIGLHALQLVQEAKGLGAEGVEADRTWFDAAILARSTRLAEGILAGLRARLSDQGDLYWREAQLAIAKGNNFEKMLFLRKTLAADPGRRDAAVLFAISVGDVERFREAAGLLRACLERHPRDAQMWDLLGQALFKAGEVKQSGPAFEKAWQYAPYNSQIAHHLAQQQEQTGQYLRARRLRQRARELAPGPDPPPLMAAELFPSARQ
ncbi:MAG: hypothetical protein NTW86_19810 [Candidatus Sumerlaeota bacterium]|nr:hypothetical protein [Candidatus Sumerlaeota bacterium]